MNDSRVAAMRLHLQTAVPLRMMALAEKGGPDAGDFAAVAAYEDVLEKRSEDLIFGGGEQVGLVAGLSRAIATLAYAPGGITIFDLHFAAGPEPVYGRAEV